MATKKPRATVELRARALEMRAGGHTVEFIARTLGVSVNSVYNWARWAREGRAAGLDDKRPVRVSAMGESQRSELAGIIESTTPEAHGFDSRLWTREIVAALVKERFGISFSPKWIGQILNDLGFTPQRPMYRSDRQDPAAVEQWRTETFPQIAELAAAGVPRSSSVTNPLSRWGSTREPPGAGKVGRRSSRRPARSGAARRS